jgi:hypothetical protein
MYVPRGLAYVKRRSPEKGVWHHAIVDHGDALHLIDGMSSIVVELVPAGPQARRFDPPEDWTREQITDQDGALRRLRLLLCSPERHQYHALFNNCEHFTRFIAFGEFRSDQVRAGVAAVVVVALLALAVGGEEKPPKRRRRWSS